MKQRHFWIFLALALVFAGTVQASSFTCNATFVISGCYDFNSFSGLDALNWGAPYPNGFGEALVGTTNTGPVSGNYINAHGNADTVSWNAMSAGGVGVQVSLTDPQLPYIVRADNTVLAWDSSQVGNGLDGWDYAYTTATSEYGRGIHTFAGHFGSPTTHPATGYSAYGDALIGASNAAGEAVGAGLMRLTFSTPVLGAGFRISSSTSGVNDNFDAMLIAYNADNVEIGSYTLYALGSGGTCAALTTFDAVTHNPGTCDDAPWIGFSGLSGVSYITVDAFDPLTNQEVSYLIDGMELGAPRAPDIVSTPEPSMMPLMGAGLLALAFAVRKRLRLSGGTSQ